MRRLCMNIVHHIIQSIWPIVTSQSRSFDTNIGTASDWLQLPPNVKWEIKRAAFKLRCDDFAVKYDAMPAYKTQFPIATDPVDNKGSITVVLKLPGGGCYTILHTCYQNYIHYQTPWLEPYRREWNFEAGGYVKCCYGGPAYE